MELKLHERLSRQQATALLNPCRLASETAHPRFQCWNAKFGVSTIITVNSGWE